MLRDDPWNQYTYDAATGRYNFHWYWLECCTDGMVLGPLPYCCKEQADGSPSPGYNITYEADCANMVGLAQGTRINMWNLLGPAYNPGGCDGGDDSSDGEDDSNDGTETISTESGGLAITADVNGDGYPDVISGTNVYINPGDGNFQDVEPIPFWDPQHEDLLGTTPESVVGMDVDGDGDQDLVEIGRAHV